MQTDEIHAVLKTERKQQIEEKEKSNLNENLKHFGKREQEQENGKWFVVWRNEDKETVAKKNEEIICRLTEF